MRQRKAFTLLELLIVIGIIAVLISILLPAISRARKQAQRLVCMNYLRQLATCVITYESDNKAQIPYCNLGNPDLNAVGPARNVYGFGWLYAYAAFRTGYLANPILNGPWNKLPHPPGDGVRTGALWPYNQAQRIYHCPVDSSEAWKGSAWMTSYLMNRAQCGFGAMGGQSKPDQPGCKASQIKDSSNSVMLWEARSLQSGGDGDADDVKNDGSGSPRDDHLSDRHDKGGHVCCFDGHVEWWDQQTWTFWASQTTFGRLWCNPLSANGH